MSVDIRAVQWNRDKLVYDGILIAAVALFICRFCRDRIGGCIRHRVCRTRLTFGFAPSALARFSC